MTAIRKRDEAVKARQEQQDAAVLAASESEAMAVLNAFAGTDNLLADMIQKLIQQHGAVEALRTLRSESRSGFVERRAIEIAKAKASEVLPPDPRGEDGLWGKHIDFSYDDEGGGGDQSVDDVRSLRTLRRAEEYAAEGQVEH